MMKTLTGLFQYFDSQPASHEIEDELRLHLDLLTDELCRQNLPREEARSRAEAQFGNFEQIRDECVEISLRNNPRTRALKSLLVLLSLIGIFVRILGTDYHVTRVGTLLITLGVLGRLFLYVRALNSSRFSSKPDALSRLILSEPGEVSVADFDQQGRTPLERLISEK